MYVCMCVLVCVRGRVYVCVCTCSRVPPPPSTDAVPAAAAAPTKASARPVRSSTNTTAPYRTPPTDDSRPLGARASTTRVCLCVRVRTHEDGSCACVRVCACSRPCSHRTSLIIVRRAADKSLPRTRRRCRRRLRSHRTAVCPA